MAKVFNDPIWGHIELSSVACKVMDTPIFQRLRDLSQLGSVSHVFPAATNRRFEHSIGVAHLSRMMVTHLQKNQPSLGISEVDILCCELAGLCHDLGHGPWSHLWDGRVLPSLGVPGHFCHEHASVQLFDLLIRQNNLEPLFDAHGLGEAEIHLVKELILGDEEEAYPGFKWVGPCSPKKAFLYDIVANKRSGVDVDKMDYFARDSHLLNIPASFDALRLIRFARVYMVKRDKSAATEVCYHQKESWNIHELYHTRYSLYKRAYLHKMSTGIDLMMAEALVLANDYISVPGTDGKPTRMSECWKDMEAYWRFTEYIRYQIYQSIDPNLQPSRAIIDRILRRDVYALVSELILDDDDEASRELKAGGILEGLHAVKDSFDPSDSAYEAVMEVQKEDIFVTILKMGYGSNGNPVDRVAFYLPGKSSPSDLSCSQDSQSTLNGNGGGGGSSSQGSMVDVETVDVGAIERDNLSRLLPVRFEERVCRVYCSRKSQKRGLTAIFNRWVENTQGKPPPTPLSPVKRKRTSSESSA